MNTPIQSALAAPSNDIDAPVLSPVIVTAKRSAPPLISSTSFDAQDIASSGASDLPTLLSLATGAQIISRGGPGAVSGLLLRGAATTQSLVLIDGVRIDSASAGSAAIAQLMLDQIERIEVINGSNSAQYGSHAMGGVVRIATQAEGAHPPTFNAAAEFGSHHTQRQHLGVAGAFDARGATTFSLSASRFKTAGWPTLDPRKTPNANPNANGFSNTGLSAALKHRLNADWDVGARFYNTQGTLHFAQEYGQPTDTHQADNQVQIHSLFADGALNSRWRTHILAARSVDRNTNQRNGAFESRFNTTNHQFNWHNTFALADPHTLRFGYEHFEQNLESSAYTPPGRRVDSGYAGIDTQWNRHRFQLNARRDQYSDFGHAYSASVGYRYALNTDWAVVARIANAFRAPSFNDLYYPDYGAPTLKPEHSASAEAALHYAMPRFGSARITVFETRYRDLIDAAPVSPEHYRAQNIGRARVRGLEAAWRGSIAKAEVRASATIQNTVNQITRQDLPRRARHFATLMLAYPLTHGRIGMTWRLSGPRHNADHGMRLGGYGVVDLHARYALNRSWTLAARIENLFNKQYELAYAYQTPPRGAYITLSWRQR